MSPQAFERKLTAILSADVAGYSRLMRDDEDLTIRTLTSYRRLMTSLIYQRKGRVVDSPGDNLLASFSSVTQAVECAVEIQRELAERNAEFPEDRRMDYRMGVNVGDVVEEKERIYGDGVNIAARLESLAEPGGICISGFVYDQVRNRLKLDYEYIGEKWVKNITEPLLVYRILLAPTIAEQIEPAKEERMAFPLPDKPSIAVLPFTNMSGDSSQDYIGDGLSENIISALSISSRIFVIARNSTFTYKEKPVRVQQVAEELGVQYVLEGSIQKSGDQLRVTAQLIDALTGHHLWSEKYDRKLEDLFDLQDEITKKIVVSLHVELTRGEDIRLYEKSTDNLDALSHHIKGLELFNQYNVEDNAKAREHFKAAIKLDPNFVTALVLLANTHLIDAYYRWSDSPSLSIKNAVELTHKALKLDEQDAVAHATLGAVYLYQRQYEKAIAEGERSITLNPNFPIGHTLFARTLFYSGRFAESIALIRKAMRLNPKLDRIWLSYLCRSLIFLRRYEEALEIIDQMEDHFKNGLLPVWYPPLISIVNQQIGREEQARDVIGKSLKTYPNFSLEMYEMSEPFKNLAHLQRELNALRNAGMPEKPRLAAREKPSIAVLPFVNMSNDPEQEYFSDGMSEELIGALAKLEGLKVISRTSAFYFKGKDVDLHTIGEKLKVDNVLEGSVRKAGNKLRISAQLINVADDTHLWAETYDRELKDVFVIQDEISLAIVKSLKVKLLGMTAEPLVKDYTLNTEAYDLFLKGRFFYSQGFSGFGKAIEYYEKTIKADPGFAPAYSKLAWAHFNNSAVFSLPSKEMWPKVKTLTLKALEIDEKDADAHAFMGKIKSCYDYNWTAAEINFKRAIELNPGNSAVHELYCTYLLGVGRTFEAIEKMKQALELDPFSVWFHDSLGFSFYFARQFDNAIAQFQKTLELAPNDQVALMGLGASYGMKGVYEEGIKRLQQVKQTPRITSWLGYLYGKAGRKDEAQKKLDDLLEGSKARYLWPVLIAIVYAGLRNNDKVFEWIEIAFEERNIDLGFIKVAPMLYDIHTDRRWSKLMKEMGLED